MNHHAPTTDDFEIPAAEKDFKIAVEGKILRPAVTWLGGESTETIFPGLVALESSHGFQLHESSGLRLGTASITVNHSPAEAVRALYERLLAAVGDHQLYRIWNYVPAINSTRADVENYHAFCAGRSQAFEKARGVNFRATLPAASAVGCTGETLTVVFVAGREKPRHFENPEQVAAYNYPREYGEHPPSFARATVVSHNGQTLVFISGTAAIKGHATVAADSLAAQLDCTLDNLSLIGRAAGLGSRLSAGSGAVRHFKVYLRHATDYDQVRTRLENELVEPDDHVTYLRADICRAALKVEIEATLIG